MNRTHILVFGSTMDQVGSLSGGANRNELTLTRDVRIPIRATSAKKELKFGFAFGTIDFETVGLENKEETAGNRSQVVKN